MTVWKIVVRTDPSEADLGQGYAHAETEREALALADHPFAYAFALHPAVVWFGATGQHMVWINPPARSVPETIPVLH